MDTTRALTLITTLAALVACDPVSKDGNTDDTAAVSGDFTELTDPCEGGGTPYGLYFRTESEGWVGCGNGFGLHGTTDGGDSFTSAHPSDDLYVFQVLDDPDGNLLVCGHDYSTAGDGVLLYRQSGSGWDDLLHYGSNNSDPASAQMSNCGQVATAGDGTLVVASNTVGDITHSEDDGLSWSREDRYWEEANLEPEGYSAYGIMGLAAAGGAYYASGSNITAPPTFFVPSTLGDYYNMRAVVADSGLMGEAWAMATPDEGATWVIGGRDQGMSSQASGFLCRSTDGGDSFSCGLVGGDIDIVHGIAFSEDGRHGVAVGHRYPPGSQGGFVLLTDDAGATWTELAVDVPILQSAAVRGQSFWVAGDAYLARGTF